MVSELTRYMEVKKVRGGYKRGDTLEIDFDNSAITRIKRIKYVIDGEEIIAGVEFISNSKYNNYFKDPLTLATLKNYDTIVKNNAESSGLMEQSSFIDFMKNTFQGQPGAGNPVSFHGPHTPDSTFGPYNNIFGARDGADVIDINDVTKLEKLFSTFKTSEEIQQIENYASDPQVRKMALPTREGKAD